MGHPRKKGKRLPSLEKIAEDKLTRCKRLTVQEWYGEKKRDIEITSKTAVWFHSRKPPLPIRWVIVRDPKKIFKTQALLCTDIKVSAEQIIEWFVRRWQVEVTFHEVRTHWDVETQRRKNHHEIHPRPTARWTRRQISPRLLNADQSPLREWLKGWATIEKRNDVLIATKRPAKIRQGKQMQDHNDTVVCIAIASTHPIPSRKAILPKCESRRQKCMWMVATCERLPVI